MTPFDSAHIGYFVVVVGFLALSTWAVSKMPKLCQSIMIILGAFLCAGLIFFSCGMGLSFENGVNWTSLARQMLQVCLFNMILVPLMLVPKFELARQYSAMFSMFAAMTTFVSIPDYFANYQWYDKQIWSFWGLHVFAVAVPLWMLAARRLKPQKKYVLPVVVCVFAYFTVVYVISEILMKEGLMTVETSHSFIYKSGHTFPLKQLYDLIGVPYFYLLPLLPVLYGFDYLFAWLFRNYKTSPYYFLRGSSVSFVTSGSAGKVHKVYGAIGDEIPLPNSDNSEEGYCLSAWRKLDDEANEEILYTPGETIKIGKKNIVLHAVWKPISADEAESVTSECYEEGAFVDG